MWAFIGVVIGLLVVYFIRYELPHLLMRRELGKENDRFLKLTTTAHYGLDRNGKRTRKIMV